MINSTLNLRKNTSLTTEFLDCCKFVRLSTVAIYMATDLIPESIYWKTIDFTHCCIFGNNVTYNRWPAIWGASDIFEEKYKVLGKGCGNSNQIQVLPNILKKGIYVLINDIGLI